MSGGSGGTAAGGAAPTNLLTAENNIFGAPGAGAAQAQTGALQGIGNTQNTAATGNALASQATGAYQAGQDPQNALFAKQFQQQQDQSNAVNAQNGVAGTPYGAALTTEGNQNFDLNWQNQQLGRENTAANTASTLLSAGAAPQQQTIQDFLSYFLGNTSNSSAYTGAANQTYANALGGAGLNNTAAQQSNAGITGALGGLGSLGGSLLKFLPA